MKVYSPLMTEILERQPKAKGVIYTGEKLALQASSNNCYGRFDLIIAAQERLDSLSSGCSLSNMIQYDDADHDGKLSINEFYVAFSKLYSVSVVSLDKALETNRLSARVGDNVEIKCDVTGSPVPPIVWRRNQLDLSTLNEEEIRVFSDGSLYLTRIQLQHAGNYTCHAQRNKDVVQTHILTVHTVPEVHVTPRIQSKRPGEDATMLCHVAGEPFPKVITCVISRVECHKTIIIKQTISVTIIKLCYAG
ncbi:hypothetical protein Zmor_006993 [Zophobas morio]|uniref:Ig-like domain-containing protein n=1 Tax=Zophobas morio TaxID=2755281 RepID=A0AA38ISX5_9CUCU|nr:hypothetical protein Zmor_006993 [Zophobas morio]